MPFAIALRLDAATAAAVDAMCDALEARGITSNRRLGYPAHITLAICSDASPLGRLEMALQRLAHDWQPLAVTFSGFAVFPSTTPSVLWVAPTATLELLTRHRDLLASLSDTDIDLYYRADTWVPHVTLSDSVEAAAEALAAVLPCWRPMRGSFVQLDLVRFRPVEVLQSFPLRHD